MKKLFYLFIIFLCFSSCGNDGIEVQLSSTPEEMGEVLFNAIKTEDATKIRTYYATESDIDEWLNKSSLSEKKKEKKRKKLIKKVASFNDNIAKRLAIIKEKEINWENTNYDWIDYKNFQKDSVTGADIYIVFSEDKKQYEIKLKECYPTNRGWVLFNDISYKGLRK